MNEEIQHAVNVITPLATMNGVQLKVSLPENILVFYERGKKKVSTMLN